VNYQSKVIKLKHKSSKIYLQIRLKIKMKPQKANKIYKANIRKIKFRLIRNC